jgi:hypothetical protein
VYALNSAAGRPAALLLFGGLHNRRQRREAGAAHGTAARRGRLHANQKHTPVIQHAAASSIVDRGPDHQAVHSASSRPAKRVLERARRRGARAAL